MTTARRIKRVAARCRSTLLRLLAMGSGFYIEYREVLQVQHAQTNLVVLGMCLIVIPPAQWLDKIANFAEVTRALSGGEPVEPDPPNDHGGQP